MRQRNPSHYSLDTQRRLHVEALEPRRVMAGNVTAEVIDGDLIITGDDAANTVSVRQIDSGSFVVASDAPPRFVSLSDGGFSVTPIDEPTQVNGDFQNVELLGVTGRIVIRAGGGDDQVTIHNVGSPFAPPGDLFIDGGSGYDYIEVGEIPRRNSLHLLGEFDPPIPGLTVAGDLEIDAAGDGGIIYVRPGTITDALKISTPSAGIEAANFIGIGGVSAASCTISGSDGTDRVSIVSLSTSGDFTLALAAGNDNVEMDTLDIHGVANIDLGAGTDRVAAMGTVRDLVVEGGTGNDSLILGGESRPERSIRMVGNPYWRPPLDGGEPVSTMELGAGGPLFVEGQLTIGTGGGDFLNLQHTRVVGNLRAIDSGIAESPEFIRLKSVSAQELVVIAGAGDDIVNVAFATAEKILAVTLDDGNDVLSMHIVAYNNSTILNDDVVLGAGFSGGDGRDTLAFGGCRFDGAAEFDGGNGDDHLLLSRSLLNHASIWMDGGANRVEIAFSAISSLSTASGADDDQVSLRTCAIDEAFFNLGEGADLLDIGGCVLGAISDADGGAGFDTLNRRNSRIKQFSATNFEAGSDSGLLFN